MKSLSKLEKGENMEQQFEKFPALLQKKNKLRKILKERGILKRAGENKFDKYSYFSEAQYKQLFTELFAECGLELSVDVESYDTFEGSERQANGRTVQMRFRLWDIDTGLFEDSHIIGEGIDKGDKAGYKAYTGAVKYYLASTFLVATGDDPEVESPDARMNDRVPKKATAKQLEILRRAYTGENLEKLLSVNGLAKIEDITMDKASELIAKLKARG